jgi:protein involved in polysaccharide export with SLBB domain
MKLPLSIKTILLFSLTVLFSSPNAQAQQTPSIEAVQSMSDQQLQSYWRQAQEQGYTLGQLEQMARLRGVSEADIQKMTNRIQSLGGITSTEKKSTSNEVTTDFGYNTTNTEEEEEEEESLIFGANFFNNPKISLEPNLNIAGSDLYQLGPGDGLSIDVWGAAQKNYSVTISKQGTVILESLSPIYVNGLTIAQASKKIKSKLSTIYAGIGSEVGADIYLSQARSIIVNIIGQVNTPGTYTLSSLATPINALYAAGGPSENGSFRSIELVRNGKTITTLDVYEFLLQGKNKQVFLQDNDVLLIPPYQNRIQIEGAVKTQGFFELKENESANDLLIYAGGFSSNAYKDELFVERIEGLKRSLVSVHKENYENFSIKDGDYITIKSVTNQYTNRVSIEGEVNVPGSYPLNETKTLKDLINQAQGFTDVALLSRGLLYRTEKGFESEIASFSISEVIHDQFNLDLKPNDRVEILSNDILIDDLEIKVQGLVNKPGNFTYYKNIKVGDVIAQAGGFRFEAENMTIDVFRNTFNNTSESISEKIANQVAADFSNVSQDLVLEPKDIVVVRQKEGYFEQETFTITGLVKKPGVYVLTKNKYTLYDAISESGGILNNAFIDGVYIKRINKTKQELKEKALDIPEEEEEEEEVNTKDITELDVKINETLNVSVNLKKLLETNGAEKYNVELMAGDEIVIPKYNSSITINGSVQQPTSLSYTPGLTFAEAVNAAGGYSETAKKSKAYVYYANGKMATKKHFLFFTANPKLKPGATIFVPEKSANSNKLSAQEVLGITSGISTLGILIKTLLQ